MNSSNVIKILGGICMNRLADESTNTERLHRSEISSSDCNRCKENASGCFRPGIKIADGTKSAASKKRPASAS